MTNPSVRWCAIDSSRSSVLSTQCRRPSLALRTCSTLASPPLITKQQLVMSPRPPPGPPLPHQFRTWTLLGTYILPLRRLQCADHRLAVIGQRARRPVSLYKIRMTRLRRQSCDVARRQLSSELRIGKCLSDGSRQFCRATALPVLWIE